MGLRRSSRRGFWTASRRPQTRGVGAQNQHGIRAVEMELYRQDVQQPTGRSARVATLVLQVFNLFDGHTKPLGKFGLGHTGMLAQSQNTASSPFHRSL